MICKEELQNNSPFWGTELDLSLILKPDSCKALSLSWRNSRIVEKQPKILSWLLEPILQGAPDWWFTHSLSRQTVQCLPPKQLSPPWPLLRDPICRWLYRCPPSRTSASTPASGEHKYCSILSLEKPQEVLHLNNPSESFPQDFHHPLVKPVLIPLLLFSAPKIKLKREISQPLLCPPFPKMLGEERRAEKRLGNLSLQFYFNK